MHASHFVWPPPPPRSKTGAAAAAVQEPEAAAMSSERLRAMKTSAMRALAGKPTTSSSAPKTTCLCAPTTHPGSFRCRMHRAQQQQSTASPSPSPSSARSTVKPLASPRRPPVPVLGNHRTCSRCLVRGRSRLSRVAYATGNEEAQYDPPEIAPPPNPLPVVRISHAAIHRGISSAAIGARLCALRRLQGSTKDDVFRVIRPTSPRPILSR